MHDSLASNRWVWALTLASILGTAVVLRFVVTEWPYATMQQVEDTAIARQVPDTVSGAQERGPMIATRTRYPMENKVLLMIVLMGTLGGLVHLSSSLAKYVGNRDLKRSWIVYYVLMPVEGAALAPMIYLLLRAGVLSTPPTVDGSMPATASLNLVVLYGFAGLTGLFSKQAIEMLADVFSTVFKKVMAKDPLKSAEGSPGPGPGEQPGGEG